METQNGIVGGILDYRTDCEIVFLVHEDLFAHRPGGGGAKATDRLAIPLGVSRLQALDLAEKGRGWTSPNPMVGAVVVKDGRVASTKFPGLEERRPVYILGYFLK